MSAEGIFWVAYGGAAIFLWPWLWGWRLRRNRGGYKYVDNGDLFDAAFEATFYTLAWPITCFCIGVKWLSSKISRTSKSAWWVPKSVRDSYRR